MAVHSADALGDCLTIERQGVRGSGDGICALASSGWLCLTGMAATGPGVRTYARWVQVHETNLKRLVQGEKQFRVPLWQRQYTWRIGDHRLLWRDILEQYAHASDGADAARSGHFLGSIVLSPVPSAASEVASYLIVDGQQRLTTLMLILAAIRDAAAKTDARAIERYDELYLINKFQTGLSRFRLLRTQADRLSFLGLRDPRRRGRRPGSDWPGVPLLPQSCRASRARGRTA